MGVKVVGCYFGTFKWSFSFWDADQQCYTCADLGAVQLRQLWPVTFWVLLSMTLAVPTADSSNRNLQRLKYWLLSQLPGTLVMGRVYTSAIQGTASCVFLALRETCMVELYTLKAPRKPLTFSNWQICRYAEYFAITHTTPLTLFHIQCNLCA